jgi:hypothetical protein
MTPRRVLGTLAAAGLLGAGVMVTRSGAGARPPLWPHEPAGSRLISDQPWGSVPSHGWEAIWGPSRVRPDPSAPGSPPGVLEITYPAGFEGGSAPGTVVKRLPALREVYVGLWWQAPAGWQGHSSNVNKIQFLFPREGGDITLVMYGPPEGPFSLRVLPQFQDFPSDWLLPTTDPVDVTLGGWHRIEWLVVMSSRAGAADGIARWWLDGRLQGDYTQLRFPAAHLTEYKLSPTWGGVGDRKHRPESFLFDHTRISGR